MSCMTFVEIATEIVVSHSRVKSLCSSYFLVENFRTRRRQQQKIHFLVSVGAGGFWSVGIGEATKNRSHFFGAKPVAMVANS